MFFFFDNEGYKPGTVCRVSGRSEGKKVVIHQVLSGSIWCYDNRPVTHRINRNGERVIEFDPACVMSPYSIKDLVITNDIPVQEDGWGAKYRRERLSL